MVVLSHVCVSFYVSHRPLIEQISTNAMGSQKYPAGINHFSPRSPLFNNRQSTWFLCSVRITITHRPGRGIIISDVGLSGMLCMLVTCGIKFGWPSLFMYYCIPYMVCNVLSSSECPLKKCLSCAITGVSMLRVDWFSKNMSLTSFRMSFRIGQLIFDFCRNSRY